jgi:hypothetical protein
MQAVPTAAATSRAKARPDVVRSSLLPEGDRGLKGEPAARQRQILRLGLERGNQPRVVAGDMAAAMVDVVAVNRHIAAVGAVPVRPPSGQYQ